MGADKDYFVIGASPEIQRALALERAQLWNVRGDEGIRNRELMGEQWSAHQNALEQMRLNGGSAAVGAQVETQPVRSADGFEQTSS